MATRKIIDDSDDGDDANFAPSGDEADHIEATNTMAVTDMADRDNGVIDREMHAAQMALLMGTPPIEVVEAEEKHGYTETTGEGPQRPHEKGRTGLLQFSSQEVVKSPGMETGAGGSGKRKRKRGRSCEPEDMGGVESSLLTPGKVIHVRMGDDDDGDAVKDGDEWDAVKTKARKKRKEIEKSEGSEVLDGHASDYLDDVGLVKEQYKPRASRSRSGIGGEELIEPVDFSRRPEKVGKTTSKKTKKVAPIVQIAVRDEEFSAWRDDRQRRPDGEEARVKEARLKEQSKEEMAQLDVSMEKIDMQGRKKTGGVKEKVVADTERPKKRGRPKKSVPPEDDGQESSEDRPSHSKAEIPTDPPKHQRQDDEETVKPGALQRNKHECNDHSLELGASTPPGIINPDRTILGAKNDNPILSDHPREHSRSPPGMISEKAEPATPSKATTASPKGPTKHSPINSGKVSYRVGLSKRARIEPLLRIVRK